MTDPSTTTTAVIVTYESSDTIDAALDQVREARDAGLLDCIVVDNASRDDSAERVARHPWVRLIRSPHNLGFGRACNLAFAEVRTPRVLLLNPDAVLPIEALRTLEAYLDDHPDVGIAAPAIREPGGLQLAGGLPTPLRVVREAAGVRVPYPDRIPIEPGAEPFETSWLCGAILLIRRQLIDDLGGFDPRFFLYFEETDLCRRAREHGWKLAAVGEAVGEHRNAASSESSASQLYEGCIPEHFFESRFYYLTKHHGRLAAICTEAGAALFETLRSLLRRGAGRDPGPLRPRVPTLHFPPRAELG